MIYRPTDRSESRGGQRTTRELAAVLVALALFAALILQFACAGADPVGDRWMCPNNARLAKLAATTTAVTPTVVATPGPGAPIWTPRPGDIQPPNTPSIVDDFGSPELQFLPTATPELPDFMSDFLSSPPIDVRELTPTPIDPFGGPAIDDRTSAILGTATALSATATARALRSPALETPGDEPFVTPTPDEGGYP